MDHPPKLDELYQCETCGMALVITQACACEDASCVEFCCCDQPMKLMGNATEIANRGKKP